MAFLISPKDPDYHSATNAARFRIPTPGVRAEADAVDWWDDLHAMTLVLPSGAAFSHTTAAQITDLPLPKKDPRPFHVTVTDHRGSRNGIAWHQRTGLKGISPQRGFPVTAPLTTWQDLGALLDVDDLVAVADVLLRRRLVTSAELANVAGLRGAVKLRAAAAFADARSWSPRESLMRVSMYRHGLPSPELNVEIIEDGILIGTGDFVWRALRSIVDCDGDQHNEVKQRTQDAQTRNAYGRAGWCHLAVTKKMYDRMNHTMQTIEDMLRDRGWPGPCTPRDLPG